MSGDYVPAYTEMTPASPSSAGGNTTAVIVSVTEPPRFYNASPASQTGSGEAKNGSICQHCGCSGPATEPRCYPTHASDTRTHHFIHPDAKSKEKADLTQADDMPPARRYRCIWKILFVLILLTLYGVSIYYIYKPINKLVTQVPVSAVTILNASNKNALAFPGIQVCNFNWGINLTNFHVFYTDPGNVSDPSTRVNIELIPNITHVSDYDYDVACFEVNNYPSKNLVISNKRQTVTIVASVPTPKIDEVTNDFCGPALCDPDLADNATIRLIDPSNAALGISLSLFQPNGVPRGSIEPDLYVPSGTYSQVFLRLLRQYKLKEPDYQDQLPAEDTYQSVVSSIPFVPNAYSFGFGGGDDAFNMNEVVFVQINFGDLAYTENNDTMPYEPFNAFGDATAIVGFFTGFGLFGGPSVLDFVGITAATAVGAKFWYSN